MTHPSKDAPRKRTVEALARRRLSITTFAATALLALTAAATAPLLAASCRLSQGLPFSDVTSTPPVQFSPDGLYAVYIHDAVVDGAKELWSVPVTGGEPVRLSGLLPSGSTIKSFEISSDSQRVVYVAPQDSTFVDELYSAPIAGPEGSWTRLNPPLVAGGEVLRFAITPDGSRVAFVADVLTDDIHDTWSVPIEGGTASRHRPAVTLAGSSVGYYDLSISPDGQRVLFLANFSDLDKRELWSARLDGSGGVTRINGALVEGGDVTDFEISPTSARVVYQADQDVDDRYELYSAPTGGGASTKLNGILPSGVSVFGHPVISPGGTRVVYFTAQVVDFELLREIFSVPILGGEPTKLNGALVSGGSVRGFVVSPSGARVVYTADQQTEGVVEIYSVPLAGGLAVKLNGALASNGEVKWDAFAISPDSSRVVYVADQQTDEVYDIYSVPLAGGAAVKINDPLVAGGDVEDFKITSGSDFVVYLADKVVDERLELFRGSILGGTATDDRVSGSMVANGDVAPSFALHPDGLRVGYVADQEVDNRWDLYLGDPCILCDGFEGGGLLRWQ